MDWLTEPLAVVIASVISSAVIAAIISNRATYRSIAVEAITKERITWLDELRAIAVELTTKFAAINRTSELATLQSIESGDRVLAQLQLHLNPDGSKEKEILRLAEELRKASESKVDYRTREVEFMLAVRRLLKEEWEKAKVEAGVSKRSAS